MKTTMKKITPDLMVFDVAESVNFYVNILGFTLGMVVPENEQSIEKELKENKKYVYGMVYRDEIFVMFMHQDEYRKDIPAFSTMDIGASVSFYVDVDNVEEYYNEIKDKVEIEKKLEETWYGMHEFYIKDNSGYILAFAEQMKNTK